MMGGSYTPYLKDLDVPGRLPSLALTWTTFCRLDELGLEVTGQRLRSDRAVLACRIVDEDRWCRRCGEQGQVRDTVTRQLASTSSRVAADDVAVDRAPLPPGVPVAPMCGAKTAAAPSRGPGSPGVDAVGVGSRCVPTPHHRPCR